ncbi:hypothetical protein [Morganella morganii]|uniref:phage tail fiber protein n=1 Tax=Morganella morganii TaxID=582 RepID=UPI0023605D0E|nr:hypothetical protein [Morganella morganii]
MIYTDGTIAIKAGSPIVTGTGTQWKKNIHGVAPGQLISIENGTAPVSMMIRAVNSDTELVLSFNAPVTLSGAKYSIATTVPDTISDAARTMSANQGYIVYFLQAMQQWMTDTGQVEIELPNGQKVMLDSIKALNDAISKIPKVVQEPGNSKTDVMSQEAISPAVSLASMVSDLVADVEGVNWKGPHSMRGTVSAISDTSNVVLDTGEGHTQIAANGGGSGWRYFILPATGGELATKEWVNSWTFTDESSTQLLSPKRNCNFYINSSNVLGLWSQTRNEDVFKIYEDGTYDGMHQLILRNRDIVNPYYTILKYTWNNGFHGGIEVSSPNGYMGHMTFWNNDRSGNRVANVSVELSKGGIVATIGGNVWVDGSGYIKKSSPIIQIYPDDNYDTNDESEGAEVRCTGTGQYHITGILGYNSDGAWGVNGGISVPKDNNGLELVYVDDRVQSDGSLIIETCHRQHAHLPERFQNWRLKEVTPEGERVFYQDGEPCDLPESTRIDVRVEMPQGSVWNVKQQELAEQMEREQAEREAQEAAKQKESAEE